MQAMRGLILDISDVDEKTITLGKIITETYKHLCDQIIP